VTVRAIYRRSFVRDLKRARSKAVRRDVRAVVEQIEHADTLFDLSNVKRLRSDRPYYRVRVGDYRLGLVVDKDTVTVVRFLHRRDIYRYFP